jgi:hypothetical protein
MAIVPFRASAEQLVDAEKNEFLSKAYSNLSKYIEEEDKSYFGGMIIGAVNTGLMKILKESKSGQGSFRAVTDFLMESRDASNTVLQKSKRPHRALIRLVKEVHRCADVILYQRLTEMARASGRPVRDFTAS